MNQETEIAVECFVDSMAAANFNLLELSHADIGQFVLGKMGMTGMYWHDLDYCSLVDTVVAKHAKVHLIRSGVDELA